MGPTIRFANIEKSSLVDGEGVRYTIFTTGCIHNCPGCHNKELQNYDYAPNYERDAEFFILDIKRYLKYIDGITFSGGDPLFQIDSLTEVIKGIRADKDLKHLNIWVYTGYNFEDIPRAFLQLVDVVVDGKYIKDLPSALYRGSNNQRIFARYPGTNRWYRRYYNGDYEVERYDDNQPIRNYY